MTTPLQLQMRRGDTPLWEIDVNNPDGTPFDLTGCTLWMTAKYAIDDLDANAIFQISTTSGEITIQAPASAGIARAQPLATRTSGLTADVVAFIDVQVRTAGGAQTFTPVTGTLLITRDITRA